MKYLNYYKQNNISEPEVFDEFINTLRSTIKVWDYFVKWNKVFNNVSSLKVELNILNSLIGSQNLKSDFIDLIKQYPNVVKTLPALLAVRLENLKGNKLKVIKDYKKQDLSYIEFDFNIHPNKKITDEEAQKYYFFLEKSGLTQLFYDKTIKNFVDYVYGVEVGLDSNGRKNRGGELMENIVEVFIDQAVSKNENLDYLVQADSSKIKQKWNYNVEFDKSDRKHDFAVYNKQNNKLFLIETNFYNGGGSKLKSVSGEFRSLYDKLKAQNIELIWITDGEGWLTAKRPLEETFNHNDYVFNLHFVQEGILEDILNKE